LLGITIGTGEQCVLAIECERTYRPLNDIGVDLDTAVIVAMLV